MNLRNTIFALLAIITAITATLFFQQEVTPPTITSSPPLIDKPVPPDEKVASPVDHATVDWASIRDRLNYEVQSFTQEEEQAFNDLHVLPLNWVVQKDCGDAGSCTMIWKYPPSAYQAMDKTVLEELAFDDPLAALMMGVRYTEGWTEENHSEWSEDNRSKWYFRSAALSGKTGPLMRLAGLGTEGFEYYGHKLNLAEELATLQIAQILGDPRGLPQATKAVAEIDQFWQQVEMSDAEHKEALRISDEQAGVIYQDYMSYMDGVQRSVTGSVQINKLAAVGGPDA